VSLDSCVRFGVIGCGTISYWTHLRILPRLRGVRLVAIADPDEAALARGRSLVDVRCHRDPQELLEAPDVDAVVVAAPPLAHASLASAALRASKHLYLEKPLATCVEDARRLAVDAADAGVTAVVGFHRRVHPTYQRARFLLDAGAIGRVRGVHTVFAEPSPAEGLPAWKRRRDSGGGVLLDLAVHHLDLLRWMLGREMGVDDCALSSTTTEHDGALLRLRADDGVEVQGRFSFRDGPADVIEFFGERGTLRVDRHRSSADCRIPRRWGYGTRRHWDLGAIEDLRWRVEKIVRPSVEPSFRRALQAFVARLRAPVGTADDLAGVADGVRTVEIVAEAEARSGAIVG
jgi:predicted dehydrogenase